MMAPIGWVSRATGLNANSLHGVDDELNSIEDFSLAFDGARFFGHGFPRADGSESGCGYRGD
jgi:hypothetical protein